MGIIQQAQDRIARYQHYKNRIEREKLMLDPTKIVLMDEFAARVAAPLVDHDPSYFATLFRLYGTLHNDILQGWISQYAIPVYLIRIADLPEEQQDMALGTLSDENLEKQVAELRAHYEAGGLDFALTEDVMRKSHAHDMAEKVQTQAVHIEHILMAADCTRYGAGGTLRHYEQGSLWRDQGGSVLKFWRDVNAMRDLSGFFPDKEPPSGNDRRKREELDRALAWKPALGMGA